MIIVANHSHFCWAREHIGQSAVFKKTLNSAQMLAGNGYFTISVPTGTEVGTFDNTTVTLSPLIEDSALNSPVQELRDGNKKISDS